MWTWVISIWCCGKLAFVPPMTFDTREDCLYGARLVIAELARDRISPTSIRNVCVPKKRPPP